MKSLKRFKSLKANSLIESVIAIAIISVCVLIAFMIYVNVVKQNDSISSYEAKHKVELLSSKALEQNDFEDNLYTFKGYIINKKVAVRKAENTALITWTIKTTNKTYVVNKLVPYHEK